MGRFWIYFKESRKDWLIDSYVGWERNKNQGCLSNWLKVVAIN
jgi:hypothetical protein